jgi:hypothetical protein
MKIKVSEDNISRGIICSPYFCPIALAIKEALPGVDAHVGGEIELTFEHGDGSLIPYTFNAPREVQKFIHLFDTKGDVESFEFELDVPQRIIDHINGN